ncbi:MAG: DNA-protecting protein DprA [Ruminococcaceae bacterium]|nr:DNA-protecting protein DprA [Oscillospiraceae bacterium]
MFDCRYWLWLSLKFDSGSVMCDTLLQGFNQNPKSIYEADREALAPFCKNRSNILSSLLDKRLDRVYKILEFCEKTNVGIITQDSPMYPSSLMNIVGKPPVLYYKGIIPDFSKKLTIGVVGTRKVTPYGSTAAYTLSHDLASAGAVVVSGLASGTDSAAHRGALDAKGSTIAFLGCGIDVIYPKENAALMEEMMHSGAVITDFAPGSRPEAWHFPIRNRLISGVSHGVLVVEASERSGALITASHALKQGKLLYAIPGKIGELASVGTNQLISNGAKTVTSSKDILSDFSGLFDLKAPVRPKRNFAPDLKTPYKTPTYKPAAPKTEPVPVLEACKPPHNTGTGYSKDVVFIERPKNNDRFEQPKPIILYNGFDGEREEKETAEAYGSIRSDESADQAELAELMTSRSYITYPKGPIPEGGYKVELTDEKIRFFDELSERSKKAPPKNARFVITTPEKNLPTMQELVKLHEQGHAEHERRVKLREELKAKGEPDYIGMSETEIQVYEFINGRGKIGVDSMGSLGLPLPKLLSVLTLLEIKHRIIQHPGGLFEIREDD